MQSNRVWLLFLCMASMLMLPLVARITGDQLKGELLLLSPEAQKEKFVLPEGFVIELVASEKEGCAKPVALSFDAMGRLWLCTATEYPIDKRPQAWQSKGTDKIMVIDDPCQEKPESIRVFADGLKMPVSVLPYKEGVIAIHGTQCIYFIDEDQDGRVDREEVLLKGLGVQDSHTTAHQLEHYPGGKIVFSQGLLCQSQVKTAKGEELFIDRTAIVTMKKDSSQIKLISSGLNNIWAWAVSQDGRVFIQEANGLGFTIVPFVEDAYYPAFFKFNHSNVPVHPPTAKNLNLGGTGFSGIAISEQKKGSFSKEFRDVFFIANPVTAKIHTIKQNSHVSQGDAFKQLKDLLVCKDPNFRPVCLVFGPDGCLYIADWYNPIINHNGTDLNHPRRDKTRGRIWRIRHRSQKFLPVEKLKGAKAEVLLKALQSDNTWKKRMAWQEIEQRQLVSAIPGLKRLIKLKNQSVGTKVHAIWSLEGLGYFDKSLWEALLKDEHDRIRFEALRSISNFDLEWQKSFELIKSLRDEKNWLIKYQVMRNFRDQMGKTPAEVIKWLSEWKRKSEGKKVVGYNHRETYLALGGSYEQEFLNSLFQQVLHKNKQPDAAKHDRWRKVLMTAKRKTLSEVQALQKKVEDLKMNMLKSQKTDIKQGELLARQRCLSCHSLRGEGVGFSPPLDGLKNRDVEDVLTSILMPQAAVEGVFRKYRVVMKNKSVLEGYFESIEKNQLVLKYMGGAASKIGIDQIQQAGYIENTSVMPEGLLDDLTELEKINLISYLRSIE